MVEILVLGLAALLTKPLLDKPKPPAAKPAPKDRVIVVILDK